MTEVRGRVRVHPRGFGFVEVEGSQPLLSAFVAPPDLNPFLEGDLVSAQVEESGPGRHTAKKLALLERERAQVFGTVTLRGGRPFLRVDRQISNTDWPIEPAPDRPLAEGTGAVATVGKSAVSVTRTFAQGVDLVHERVIARHGLPADFTPEQRQAAEAVSKSPRHGPRRDLRDIPTVTLDAAHSLDMDDALSALPPGPDGAVRILVSIADVDAFVPEGSVLDLEARRRGTSVYLAGRVLPMLPDVLSNQAISLVEGKDRPALTVELRIDTEGELRSVDVYESLIKSHARLTYDAAAEFLATGRSKDVPEPVQATLRLLRTAASRLSVFRASRGGIELLREEASITIDRNEPTGVIARVDTSAHRLVERLMVATNEAVAKWLVDRGLPGIFRVHPEPDADKVERLDAFAKNFGFELATGPTLSPRALAAFEAQWKGATQEPALRTVLGRVLGPARYSHEPGMHFGLAAPMYLHFTSPIRRYADLLVHRICKRYLAGDRSLSGLDLAYEELAAEIDDRSVRAAKAEMDSVWTLAARLYAGKIGEAVSGNIVSVKPFGLVAQMAGTGITGTIALDALGPGAEVDLEAQTVKTPKRVFSVGDALELTVAGANEDLARIDLALR
jgi:ribonuclease R